MEVPAEVEAEIPMNLAGMEERTAWMANEEEPAKAALDKEVQPEHLENQRESFAVVEAVVGLAMQLQAMDIMAEAETAELGAEEHLV